MAESKEVARDPNSSATTRKPSVLEIEALGAAKHRLYRSLRDKLEALHKVSEWREQGIGSAVAEQLLTDLQPALEHLGIDVSRSTHNRSWILKAGGIRVRPLQRMNTSDATQPVRRPAQSPAL
jgi:hypothetical protein